MKLCLNVDVNLSQGLEMSKKNAKEPMKRLFCVDLAGIEPVISIDEVELLTMSRPTDMGVVHVRRYHI